MGRFPWGNGHSKQSSDKLHAVAHDWFSKDGAEPSRQALTDLMKDHASTDSGHDGESPKGRGRSRTNTVTSSFSLYAPSTSDGSNDMTSRPPSQHSFVDSGLAFPERPESTAKALLSKSSRLLKRQGSKLSLLPSQMEDKPTEYAEWRGGETSPIKNLQRQLTLNTRYSGIKRNISGPFAFQHLTHGDQAHFQSLDSVSKTDLTSEFHAIHAVQLPDDKIRGIPVTDLPSKKSSSEQEVRSGSDEPASPTTNAIPYLPATPPRPHPPPKDVLASPYSPSDFRMSRSMENFSRPTRLSVSTSDISSQSDLTGRLSTLSPINRSIVGKPLPLTPAVGHAVTTKDDIAVPLRLAPLPSPPRPFMEVVEEERVVSSTPADEYGSSRGTSMMSLSLTQSKRRSQSSGDMPLTTIFPAVPSAKPAGNEVSPKSRHRISIGVRAIQIEDWEDAIDYSWDHAADLEDLENNSDSDATIDRPRGQNIPHDNYLVVQQKLFDETSSSASTPLMMQAPNKIQNAFISVPPRQFEEEPSSPLLGLGIGSLNPTASVSMDEAAVQEVQQSEVHSDSAEMFGPAVMRSPNSIMSKSSSQESIILSIASSIIGTHRSSNSSTSLSDFAQLANFGDSMESLKLELQDFTSTSDNHFREGSQDTIRGDSRGSMPPWGEYDGSMIDSSMPFTTSPTIRHDRGASASEIPIPERKSSMPGVDISKAQAGRRRAGTTTSRPRRNTRVSYSLFPTTATGA